MFHTRVETLTMTPPMWVVLLQKKNNLCSNFNLDTQNIKVHIAAGNYHMFMLAFIVMRVCGTFECWRSCAGFYCFKNPYAYLFREKLYKNVFLHILVLFYYTLATTVYE
jgi:hypothetical protein